MNNNLLKIDNQYLKFVVTTNSSIPKILQNTGTVSIVHDNTDVVNRNKLYIADEFIASGYGVGSAELATNNAYLAETYNDIVTYFTTAYAYALDYTTNVDNNIREAFVLNTGSVSSTYIVLDGNELKLEDIRKILKPAQYDDLNIVTSYSYVSYQTHKYVPTTDEFNTINIESNNNYNSNTCYTLNDMKFDIPYGAHITRFYSYLYLELNNHRGINGIKYNNNDTLYNVTSTNVNLSNELIGQTVKVVVNFINPEQNIFAINDNQILLDNYKLHDAGSASEIKYPLLDVDIKSTENFIEPYDIECNDVVLNTNNAVYYYQIADTDDGVNFIKDFYKNQNVKFAQTNDLNNVELLYNKNTAKQMIVIAVPKQYDIDFAYYRDTQDDFIENCTGDIYKMINSSDNDSNDVDLFVYNLDTTNTCYKYNVYALKFRTDAYQYNQTIHIKLIENDSTDNSSTVEGTTNITAHKNDVFVFTGDFIQNELYNSMHWFTPDDLIYLNY